MSHLTFDIRTKFIKYIFFLVTVLTWLKQVSDGRVAFNLKRMYQNNKQNWYDSNWKNLSHKSMSTVTTRVKDGMMSN